MRYIAKFPVIVKLLDGKQIKIMVRGNTPISQVITEVKSRGYSVKTLKFKNKNLKPSDILSSIRIKENDTLEVR